MVLRLVLDTNRIIAALINRHSSIRDILLSQNLVFFLPEDALQEIEKYKDLILKKSGLTENQFYFTLYYLLQRVHVAPRNVFMHKLKDAGFRLKHIDPQDAPFLALALAVENDGIFSDDLHFEKVGIKRWTVDAVLKQLHRP